MTRKSFVHFLMPSVAMRSFCVAASADAATFTTFDPAGSVETLPYSINASGAITGFYITRDDKGHGFVRAADGTITTFDLDGSVVTMPFAIDDNGRITGEFTPHNRSHSHGFIRDTDGTIKGDRRSRRRVPNAREHQCRMCRYGLLQGRKRSHPRVHSDELSSRSLPDEFRVVLPHHPIAIGDQVGVALGSLA
jgi:hypothetical protein